MLEGRLGAPRRARSGRARLRRSALAPTLIALAVIVASGATTYLAAPAAATDVSVPLVPLPQFSSPDQPNISVVGVGRSSRPAETAMVQILIGRQDAGFSVSEVTTAEGSSGSTSGGLVPIAEGTPDPGSVQITPDELSPILDALETAGVARDHVATIFSPLATEPFARPSGSARLDFELQRPTTEAMTELSPASLMPPRPVDSSSRLSAPATISPIASPSKTRPSKRPSPTPAPAPNVLPVASTSPLAT